MKTAHWANGPNIVAKANTAKKNVATLGTTRLLDGGI